MVAALLLAGCTKRDEAGEAASERPNSTKANDETPRAAICGEAPCLAIPTGIKGLSFGMEPEEVRTSLKLSDWSPPELPYIVVPSRASVYSWEDRRKVGHHQLVPGVSTSVDTTLGGADATCRLDFTEAKTLVGITCSVERAIDLEELFGRIASNLQKRHGAATEKDRPEGGMVPSGRRITYHYEWRSADAVLRLELAERQIMLRPDSFTLSNLAASHDAAIVRAQAAADQALEDQEDRARRAARAEEEAARRALEAGKKELLDDLSGAAEKPPSR